MYTAVKAPFLTVIRNPVQQPLPMNDSDHRNFMQKQNTITVATTTYDQLVLRYQIFVDAAIEDYKNVYRHYVQQGGQRSFFDRCWTMLLNDAVEEAANLLAGCTNDSGAKEKLWQSLKRISEGYLLVLDKALL